MNGPRGQLAPLYPSTESESWQRIAFRYAAPWLMGVTVLLAGALAHLAWGKGAVLPWATTGMTLGTVGLSWLSWTVARSRHLGPMGRGQVVATVAATGSWLLIAVITGPFVRGVIDAWALLTVLLAGAWNLRMGLHRPVAGRGNGEDGEKLTPRKAGKAFLAAVGVKGEQLEVEEVNEHRIGGKLQLTSAQNTVEDVQKKRNAMAAALGIPKAGVRFSENPENAGEAEFSFTLRDVLAKSTPWPGPSHVGGTPFDPIPMGLYETGKTLVKTIANAAGAKHELTQGASGSGKSSGTRIEVCEEMTRRELAIIMIDTKKGTQAFGPAAPGLAWFITDDATAAEVLRRIQRKVIPARTSYLGARGLDAWQPGCGLTFLCLYIEEASGLFAEIGDSEVEEIAKAARSAGILLKLSLQRPDHTQLSTTLRGQMGSITCYGMAADDPVCLLPDAVLDAGAEPQRWGDRMPGCCYVSGTGIAVGDAATPARTFEITPAQLAAHAQQYGPQMDPIDPVTIAAFGELWRKRIDPVELVNRLNAKALKAAGMQAELEGGTPADDGEETSKGAEVEALGGEPLDDAGDDEGEGVGALTPEEMGVTTPDDDPDATSIDDEIESIGHDVVFAEAKPEVSVDEAREAVAGRIDGFELAGRDVIRAPDFNDLIVELGRSRAWFRKELKRLVELGRLKDRDGGLFEIVPTSEADGADESGPARAA